VENIPGRVALDSGRPLSRIILDPLFTSRYQVTKGLAQYEEILEK